MKLFVIGGKAKSGKNTFATLLREELKDYNYKPCVMHLTNPLYSYAQNYFEWNENCADARLKEEFNYLTTKYNDIITIKLERDNYENNLTISEKEHITEKDLDNYDNFDYFVKNTSLADLKESARQIIKNEEGESNE